MIAKARRVALACSFVAMGAGMAWGAAGATLPIAAPEIIKHEGTYYIAALLPSLQGIQIARLEWVRPAGEPQVRPAK